MKNDPQSPVKLSLFFTAIILAVVTVSTAQQNVEAKKWTFIHDNIPEEAKRIRIPLEFEQTSSSFYRYYQRNITSNLVEQDMDQKFMHQIELGLVPDGYSYSILIRDAGELKFLHENSYDLYEIKVLRSKNDDHKDQTVTEGYLFSNRSITIPFKTTSKQVNLPTDKSIKGTIEISFSRDSVASFCANMTTRIEGDLSGKIIYEYVSLRAEITPEVLTEIHSGNLNLYLKPYDDKMLSTYSKGKLSDTFSLGTCKLVVEKIASDNSELVLALMHGQLLQEKIVQKEEEMGLKAGVSFPDFTRIDLVKRKPITLADLKTEVGGDGYIVLIFGEFRKYTSSRYCHSLCNGALNMNESIIYKTLSNELEKKLAVGFVCQSLSMYTLYDKWLGTEPDFYVLSDFSNVLKIGFHTSIDGRPNFNQHSGIESLRRQLGFTDGITVITLIDGKGNLVYKDYVPDKELSKTIIMINQMIKDYMTPAEQNSLTEHQ